MMATTHKYLRIVFCLFMFSQQTYLQAEELSTTEQKNWGIDFDVQHQHQVFKENEDLNANLNTFSITPYYQIGDFSFSLYVPWQKVSSQNFVNGVQSAPTRLCTIIAGLTPLQIQFLINRKKITQTQVNNCQTPSTSNSTTDESTSGLGDISLSANYYLPLDEAGVWLAGFGVVHKFDNGDAESGLGSGTSETSFESSMNATLGKFSSDLLLGYSFVSGDDSEQLNNFGYAKLRFEFSPSEKFSFGDSLNAQQALIEDEENIQWNTLYVNFKPTQQWNLQIYTTHYFKVDGYPNREIGFGVGYSL